MSDPAEPVPPAAPSPPVPPSQSLPPLPAAVELPPDRPWVQSPQQQGSGSSFGAVILFICSFLSLLSTGCFGLFAVGINERGAWAFFAAGALVMACVTSGFFLAARALQRRARK